MVTSHPKEIAGGGTPYVMYCSLGKSSKYVVSGGAAVTIRNVFLMGWYEPAIIHTIPFGTIPFGDFPVS